MCAGYWPMGYVVCNIWQTMDVMLCTSSIWHMCTISIDRYFGIRYPLKAAAVARLNHLRLWINHEYNVPENKLTTHFIVDAQKRQRTHPLSALQRTARFQVQLNRIIAGTVRDSGLFQGLQISRKVRLSYGVSSVCRQ